MKKYCWKCPKCDAGRLLGPRPKKNATARFCLSCSEKIGTLVEMICPVLDTKRTHGRERSVTKTKQKKVRADRIYMMEDGYDIRKMYNRVWRIARRVEPSLRRNPPALVVKYGGDFARTLGTAYYGYRRAIMVKRGPRNNPRLTDKMTTIIIHEIAHFITWVRGGYGHDEYFKGAMVDMEHACKREKLTFYLSNHTCYIGTTHCTAEDDETLSSESS